MGLPVLKFDGIVEVWMECVDEYINYMKQKDILQDLFGER
jgi:hypothetical protein